MRIIVQQTVAISHKAPAAVLFAFENERARLPGEVTRLLARTTDREFKGEAKQSLVVHTNGALAPDRLLLVGLGKRAEFSLENLRRAAGPVTRKLRDLGLSRFVVQLPADTAGLAADDCVEAIVEALLLAEYRFDRFQPATGNRSGLDRATVCVPRAIGLGAARAAAVRATTIAAAANYARGIADLPGNLVVPATLAAYARRLAREAGLRCRVYDKAALRRGGFGGLLAVGGGSSHDPRLIVLEYRGARGRRAARPIALVGKAITFDSGGISLKPSDKMDEMKFDKCGGVAVLGTLQAAAALRLPVNLLGIIAAAENLPSATCYRPGDIITSYRGNADEAVTIEVLNTDAEGRVVLGDALAYAREHGARAIIDLATLTGACVVALGPFAAGLFGNDDALQERLRAAGARTGERLWPMPLWQEYKDKIKSEVATIKNTGGREGGACTAGAFLAAYVGDTPWAHLDIAGTAQTTTELPYLAKGATGFGVRLLVETLRRWNEWPG